MEAGNWLPLLDRERFPSSVLSAILSAAALAKAEGPAKTEGLEKEAPPEIFTWFHLFSPSFTYFHLVSLPDPRGGGLPLRA